MSSEKAPTGYSREKAASGIASRHPRSCLILLTYYSPYVSGLTSVAAHTAEALARRGWRVTVVCTDHAGLPREETINGVRVLRSRAIARLSKGVISPGFIVRAAVESRRHDVAIVLAPLAESALMPLVLGCPYLFHYVCDIVAGPSVGSLIPYLMDVSHRLGLTGAAMKAVLSRDYAAHSRIGRHLTDAVDLPPPCPDQSGGEPVYRQGRGRHVGFLGRIVSEKGLPELIRAFRARASDEDILLLAGDYTAVAGGSIAEDVLIEADGDNRIRLLGRLEKAQVRDFFASIDVLALPSTNALEAFGIVQVEAMSAGCRVVASDLPGVRVPLQTCGGGSLVPPGNVSRLAEELWKTSDVAHPVTADPIAIFGLEANADRVEQALEFLTTRDRATGRRTAPTWRAARVDLLPWDEVKQAGVRGVLLDVENTLAAPMGTVDSRNGAVLKTLARDFDYVAFVTNSRGAWVEEVTRRFNLPVVIGRKPSTSTFLSAAYQARIKPTDLLMVGDQYVTDIWGASRLGMKTAQVDPLGGDPNLPSKVNRAVTRLREVLRV